MIIRENPESWTIHRSLDLPLVYEASDLLEQLAGSSKALQRSTQREMHKAESAEEGCLSQISIISFIFGSLNPPLSFRPSDVKLRVRAGRAVDDDTHRQREKPSRVIRKATTSGKGTIKAAVNKARTLYF